MAESGKTGFGMAESEKGRDIQGRLLSLDLFRGATMFLLVAESTRLYSELGRRPGRSGRGRWGPDRQWYLCYWLFKRRIFIRI